MYQGGNALTQFYVGPVPVNPVKYNEGVISTCEQILSNGIADLPYGACEAMLLCKPVSQRMDIYGTLGASIELSEDKIITALSSSMSSFRTAVVEKIDRLTTEVGSMARSLESMAATLNNFMSAHDPIAQLNADAYANFVLENEESSPDDEEVGEGAVGGSAGSSVAGDNNSVSTSIRRRGFVSPRDVNMYHENVTPENVGSDIVTTRVSRCVGLSITQEEVSLLDYASETPLFTTVDHGGYTEYVPTFQSGGNFVRRGILAGSIFGIFSANMTKSIFEV